MALTEKKVREKILAEIWAICPTARKIRRNPFTGDRSKWAGHFTHEVEINGEMTPVTLAFIARRTGYKPRSKSVPFEQYIFEILGFKGYVAGTEAENSEDDWQLTIERIARRLADLDTESPVWEFEDEEDEVTTEYVEFRPIGLIDAGGFLHFGGGQLVVNIHRC
ncbi:MAG TPA: hypothetical protein VGC76_14520 [Pyrinomonadaceae bacterium]|jgi:hypothetical protein